MKTHFLLFLDHGPSWVAGASTREQPLWDEHAVFVDRLFEQGRIVMAGPYADHSRALVIVKARDAEEAKDLYRDDPWRKADILKVSEAIEWTVFLDSQRSGG